MTVLLSIIQIIFGIAGIILFVKIWLMTDDVKAIRELLETRQGSPTTSPRTASAQAIKSQSEANNPQSPHKGGRYILKDYGVCFYEGVYDKKYYFYPPETAHLKPSPFLICGDEPHLAIPREALPTFDIKPD